MTRGGVQSGLLLRASSSFHGTTFLTQFTQFVRVRIPPQSPHRSRCAIRATERTEVAPQPVGGDVKRRVASSAHLYGRLRSASGKRHERRSCWRLRERGREREREGEREGWRDHWNSGDPSLTDLSQSTPMQPSLYSCLLVFHQASFIGQGGGDAVCHGASARGRVVDPSTHTHTHTHTVTTGL